MSRFSMMRSNYKRSAVYVVGLIIFFVLIDLAFGRFVFRPNSPYSNLREFIQRPQSPQLYLPQPFQNYINNPASITPEGERQIDDLGLRHSHKVDIPKPVGTLRILFLGGSTTFGEVDKTSEAFPALSEKILNDSLKEIAPSVSKVECLNAGMGASTSAEVLIQYLLKLKYLDADVAVIHMGINDAFTTARMPDYVYQPDYHTSKRIMKDVYQPSRAMRLFSHSNIASYFMIQWHYREELKADLTNNEFFEYHNRNVWFPAGNDSIRNPHYNAFFNNLIELIRTTKSSGMKVLLVTEVVEKDQMPAQLQTMLLDGIELNQKLMIKAAAETGVPICILNKEDFPAKYFHQHDGIHLNKDGEELLTQKLMPYLFTVVGGIK